MKSRKPCLPCSPHVFLFARSFHRCDRTSPICMRHKGCRTRHKAIDPLIWLGSSNTTLRISPIARDGHAVTNSKRSMTANQEFYGCA